MRSESEEKVTKLPQV